MGLINLGQSNDGDGGQRGSSPNKSHDNTNELLQSVLGDENKKTETDKMEMELCPSESQMIVHGSHGSFLMEKSWWPSLKLRSEKPVLGGENLGELT